MVNLKLTKTQVDQLSNQKWNGPKVAKYGSKYLGIYDLQLSTEEQEKKGLTEVFNTLSKQLKYSQFRKSVWKGEVEIYQFICPLKTDEIKSYKKDPATLEMNTKKILEYAEAQETTSSINANLNQCQVKNRSARETKWKEWYQQRLKEDAEIESLKVDFIHKNVDSIDLKYEKKLLPFQVNHVKNLLACLNKHGVALDASDTGTGKTYSALCLAKELNLIPIVVCPKSIIPGWTRAMQHFDIEDFFVCNYEQFRNGRTPYLNKIGVNPDYKDFRDTEQGKKIPVKSWQKYEYDKAEKEHRENSSKIPKLEYEWTIDATQHLLIFDECHKTKNTNTQNYAIYWWAQRMNKDKNLKILSLSATVADKIVNAYSICYMLDLVESGHDFNLKYNIDLDKGILKDFGYEVTQSGFYRFNNKYQKAKEKYQNENTNLKKLHNDLFPIRGSRMIIEDLGDSFPDNFVEAQAYDMDSRAKEIQKIYREMESAILEIKYKAAQAKQQELLALEEKATEEELLPKEIRRMNELRRDKDKNLESLDELREKLSNYGKKITIDHLNNKSFGDETKHLFAVKQKARQRVELLKADTLVELGADFLEQNKSVAIFVNFIETLDYLHKKFSTKMKATKTRPANISIVKGGQTVRERQRNIDLFQNNTNHLILLTMQSGRESISLHDQHGGHPRVSLISPSWSAQDLVQALGRIHRAEGKTTCLQYLVYCNGTIEDRICEIIQRKIETINLINDGDLSMGLQIN